MFVRPTVKSLEVNAVRLSYRECGDPAGAPVLLLHGSGSDATTWDRLAGRLADAGHRCIALDLRGHAASARTDDYSLTSIRDDVVALLEALSLRDATVIGHSVGGYAALAAALRVPGRIGRLVLEDPAAPPSLAASLTATGVIQAAGAAAAILTQRRNYQLRAVVAILRQLARPDPHWWTQLHRLTQPTLILSGGPTSCIPPQRLAAMTAALPDARLATIPVGHRVHSLAPDRFAAEVAAFLAQTFGGPLPAAHPLVAGS